MAFLLDTHAFLWFVSVSIKLAVSVRDKIMDRQFLKKLIPIPSLQHLAKIKKIFLLLNKKIFKMECSKTFTLTLPLFLFYFLRLRLRPWFPYRGQRNTNHFYHRQLVLIYLLFDVPMLLLQFVR